MLNYQGNSGSRCNVASLSTIALARMHGTPCRIVIVLTARLTAPVNLVAWSTATNTFIWPQRSVRPRSVLTRSRVVYTARQTPPINRPDIEISRRGARQEEYVRPRTDSGNKVVRGKSDTSIFRYWRQSSRGRWDETDGTLLLFSGLMWPIVTIPNVTLLCRKFISKTIPNDRTSRLTGTEYSEARGWQSCYAYIFFPANPQYLPWLSSHGERDGPTVHHEIQPRKPMIDICNLGAFAPVFQFFPLLPPPRH